MIVGYEQTDDGVDIAHIDKHGNISVRSEPAEFSNYVQALPTDPNLVAGWTDFHEGQPIRRVPSRNFNQLELREFITRNMPEKARDEVLAYNLPNIYSVDIEVDMSPYDDLVAKGVYLPKHTTKEDYIGFPIAEKAYRPIESISITTSNLDTVVFTTTNDRLKEGDAITIEQWINEYFSGNEKFEELIKDHTKEGKLGFTYIVVKDEVELLRWYNNAQREFMHSIAGWNWHDFDSEYIKRRCAYLQIDRRFISPVKKLDKRTGNPVFRSEYDYMAIQSKYGSGYAKRSKGLGYVAQETLGISKVPYDGSFIDLYNGDYRKFIFYNAVDTILVAGIHLYYNAIGTMLTMSYYAKIPIDRSMSVTQLGDAMWFDELYENKQFNVFQWRKLSEKEAKFVGGYVMTPRRKSAQYVAICDYASLYPMSIKTGNASPEAYLGTINMNDKAARKWVIDQGHALSMNGNYYRNEGANVLKRIVGRLVEERYHYKGECMMKLELDVIEPLEAEMIRRGIKF